MMSYKYRKFERSVQFICMVCLFCTANVFANPIVKTIKEVTPSVVAIGKKTPIENQGSRVLGTGFAVGDGSLIVTNYHVVSEPLSTNVVEFYVALSGEGQIVNEIKGEVLAIDPVHDIAIMKIERHLPPLILAGDKLSDIGTDIAFTGYPIGAILGLYAATHKGSIAAITPDAIPAHNADYLTINMLKRLEKPSLIYQLDATAYPGNSGSAVYLQESGEVVGIINKVIVKDTKESALSNPSGISYAVPVAKIRALAKKHGFTL